MLSGEENELLTRTDRGTPCGELMRRYWQPAALSEELPAGGAPVAVYLLGEDLVLFRDQQKRPGLLGPHCSRRGADLSYGHRETEETSFGVRIYAVRKPDSAHNYIRAGRADP